MERRLQARHTSGFKDLTGGDKSCLGRDDLSQADNL